MTPPPCDPAIHHRRSIRLRGYDYSSPGRYFVTMCVADRHARFGAVVHGRMILSEAGQIAAECWRAIPQHFPHVALDEWVVMPNHVHGIIAIQGTACPAPTPAPTHERFGAPVPGSLATIVRSYKAAVSKGTACPAPSPLDGKGTACRAPLWQRNYYEIIIRNELALRNIRAYIRFNPQNYEAVMNSGEPAFLGNRALLDGPKLGFLASRGETEAHGHLPLKAGETIISGFLSPMERAVFKAGLAHGKPLIWVKPWALADGVDSPAIRQALDDGRLLILSPFEKAADAPSVRRAAWCNEYVMHHCEKLVIGHLKPGGMLECLLSDAPLGLAVERFIPKFLTSPGIE